MQPSMMLCLCAEVEFWNLLYTLDAADVEF
jgi:hypothetical protein